MMPECPNIPRDLIDYIRAIFPSDIGATPRRHEDYLIQTGEQRVVAHLSDQLRRQAAGE